MLPLFACRFGVGALEALTPGLQSLTMLTQLNLSFNGIMDSTTPHLAAVLPYLSCLRSLCLSENEITGAGTLTLTTAVSTLDNLQAVSYTHLTLPTTPYV